jgi:hypothetical protein
MSAETMTSDTILAWLEAKRIAIEKAKAAITELKGLEKGPGASSITPGASSLEPGGGVPEGAFLGMTIGDAAKKYLGMVHKAQTTAQICEGLKHGGFHSTAKNFIPTVYSALAREGEVIKVKRGQWALKEWYPGLRRKAEANGEHSEQPHRALPYRRIKLTAGQAAMKAAKETRTAGQEIVDEVMAILKETGTPLHVSKISEALKVRGRTIAALPLSSQLSRSVKTHRAPLRIVERGVFGLAEKGGEKTSA